MITYEMIEAKIDRLIEQGAWVFYDYNLDAYNIGNMCIDVANVFIKDENIHAYMFYEKNKSCALFAKMEKLCDELINNTEINKSDIINYLES